MMHDAHVLLRHKVEHSVVADGCVLSLTCNTHKQEHEIMIMKMMRSVQYVGGKWERTILLANFDSQQKSKHLRNIKSTSLLVQCT